ncbi:capsid assembly scaffolding protein Gp46 family protein [Lactococcus muris]|uniref:capsid assembly scaffolding protein Gp46 family protein n=1 Tax=Lactococcus muris TaxID=2941330 RepID=UPI0023012B1A
MSEFKPITSQEDLDKIINARLARQKETIEAKYEDYDQVKTRNAELETENSNLQETVAKSGEAAKTHEQTVSDLQAQIAKHETSQLRTQVALQAGLPYDLAGRLQGDDEESLKADAERLSGFMKPKAPAAPLKSQESNLGDGKDGAYKALAQNLSTEGE